jgi:hypothetical protein
VFFNTAVALPGNGISSSQANTAAILATGNTADFRTASIFAFKNIELSNTTGRGAYLTDSASYTFIQVRFNDNATERVNFNTQSPYVTFSDCDIYSSTNTDPHFRISGNANVTVSRSLFTNGLNPITQSGFNSTLSLQSSVMANAKGIAVYLSTGRITNILNTTITCNGNTDGAIQLSDDTTVGGFAVATGVQGVVVATCGYGVLAKSGALINVTTLSGTAATTALYAVLGGVIQYTSATTITGTSQDISVEAGAYTGNLASVASGNCASSLTYGSKICQQ